MVRTIVRGYVRKLEVLTALAVSGGLYFNELIDVITRAEVQGRSNVLGHRATVKVALYRIINSMKDSWLIEEVNHNKYRITPLGIYALFALNSRFRLEDYLPLVSLAVVRAMSINESSLRGLDKLLTLYVALNERDVGSDEVIDVEGIVIRKQGSSYEIHIDPIQVVRMIFENLMLSPEAHKGVRLVDIANPVILFSKLCSSVRDAIACSEDYAKEIVESLKLNQHNELESLEVLIYDSVLTNESFSGVLDKYWDNMKPRTIMYLRIVEALWEELFSKIYVHPGHNCKTFVDASSAIWNDMGPLAKLIADNMIRDVCLYALLNISKALIHAYKTRIVKLDKNVIELLDKLIEIHDWK